MLLFLSIVAETVQEDLPALEGRRRLRCGAVPVPPFYPAHRCCLQAGWSRANLMQTQKSHPSPLCSINHLKLCSKNYKNPLNIRQRHSFLYFDAPFKEWRKGFFKKYIFYFLGNFCPPFAKCFVDDETATPVTVHGSDRLLSLS